MAVAALEPVQVIPLAEAVLCVDCLAVTNTNTHRCAACQSPAVMSLARVLEREQLQMTEGE